MSNAIICLWYDKDAEEAARFYCKTFPDSAMGAVQPAPSDFPGGKQGELLVVEFTVLGISCIGLNGGPALEHYVAFSFMVSTRTRPKPTNTGMRSSAMVDRKALAAGARTSGVCPGRSPPRS